MNKRELEGKINNKGFTLIEVIVAVIIMAVASIPILNSFMSSVRTSARAVSKQKATNVAEEVYEDIKSLSVKGAILKYGLEEDDEGKYTSSITKDTFDTATLDNDEVKRLVEGGYKIDITMDPTGIYADNNSENIASFDTISDTTAAIYNMSPGLESRVNAHYMEKLVDRDVEESYFDRNLKREIRIDIEKVSDEVDEKGHPVEICTVDVTVSYVLIDGADGSVINRDDAVYVPVTKTLFSNQTTLKPLSSIMVMYYPRYEAAGDRGDIITVHNPDNVSTNLYIIAQGMDTDRARDYLDKRPTGGAYIRLFQDKIKDELGEDVYPLRLFTNLHTGSLSSGYYAGDNADVLAYLTVNGNSVDPLPSTGDRELNQKTYGNLVSPTGTWGDSESGRRLAGELKAADINGRSLNEDDIQDRIYNITILVDKDVVVGEGPDGKWPNRVEFTGTKIVD